MLKITTKTSTVGANNVIVIRDKYTLPKNSMPPDFDTQFFVSIENKDTDATKKATGVVVDLYDAGLFKGFKDGNPVFCTSDSTACMPDYCKKTEPCEMSMASEKSVVFMLKSPSLDDIAGISRPHNLNFKVSYEYSVSSSVDVVVVDKDEVVRRQRAGEVLSTTVNEVQGSGPIKVDIEKRVSYILAGNDGIIIFKISDRGNGELKDSKITKGNLRIEFLQGLVADVKKNLQGDIDSSGSSSVKKCGVTAGYYCVSGEQRNDCLEGMGLGEGTTVGCNDGEKCCVTCSSKICTDPATGSKYPCSCTNNCIVGSREAGGRDCASGEKCCASASSITGAVTGMATAEATTTTAMFACSQDGSKVVCINNKDISLFRDQSEPLWFMIKGAPSLGGAPFKTYPINVYIDSYTYELRDSTSVQVTPPTA
ncbi:MAG: hypothetical protein HZB67_01825 [Candidatus Aenigmarchaeota archaeon]|nr:hypothetical protein [Candidatus Aenigmarchaeota archaeon]